jgi:outer membrane protein
VFKSLLLAALCALSFSAQADDLKIGVIDVRSIISTSKQAQAVSEKLQKEFAPREKDIAVADKAFQEKADKFKRDSAVMSESERTNTERDMLNLQRELQRKQAEFREDTSVRQQQEMQQFLEKVKTAVNSVAEKDKMDLIIHSDAVPYAKEKLDITQKVVQALDAG